MHLSIIALHLHAIYLTYNKARKCQMSLDIAQHHDYIRLSYAAVIHHVTTSTAWGKTLKQQFFINT